MLDGKIRHQSKQITLQLLDSAQGHVLQHWRFEDKPRVTVGRAEENDVQIADPQVSRCHAELYYRDGAWTLVSVGRNGTIVDGEKVTELPVADRTIFQLGAMGPSFRFLASIEMPSHMATIGQIDLDTLEFLAIDEQKKQDEVQQIVENDAFKALQERSRLLRQAPPTDDKK